MAKLRGGAAPIITQRFNNISSLQVKNMGRFFLSVKQIYYRQSRFYRKFYIGKTRSLIMACYVKIHFKCPRHFVEFPWDIWLKLVLAVTQPETRFDDLSVEMF